MSLACMAVGLITYTQALHAALHAEQRHATQRLDFYALSLASTIDRHETLPLLLAMDRDMLAALKAPDDAARQRQANDYLSRSQRTTQVAVAYLLNAQGETMAASNWADPLYSFVGHNYNYRPYFQDAMAGRVGRFYGIGRNTGEPGFFIAAPVRDGQHILGAVVVKISLASFEEALLRSGEKLTLTDANGVIFLSTLSELRYRSRAPLSSEVLTELASSQQYGDTIIEAVPTDAPIASTAHERNPEKQALTVLERPIDRLGWHIVLLINAQEAHRTAVATALAASIALALLWVSISYVWSRRHHRLALIAHETHLEHQIAERTQDLTSKVNELKRTEARLRQTREEAIQAGKLAVLGQMAAGLSHELSQPLAALSTTTDNTLALLDRGHVDAVRENLLTSLSLTDRMARLIRDLKRYVRKTPFKPERVLVAQALTQAARIALPHDGAPNYTPRWCAALPDQLAVTAEGSQLEQIFINLIRNAMESMQSCPDGRLEVSAVIQDNFAHVHFRDHGSGLPPERIAKLFEPFFTTKPDSGGLGLGLAISKSLVEGFGGQLSASNHPDGGAVFTVTLPIAQEPD